jgi:hypothetical protein
MGLIVTLRETRGKEPMIKVEIQRRGYRREGRRKTKP